MEAMIAGQRTPGLRSRTLLYYRSKPCPCSVTSPSRGIAIGRSVILLFWMMLPLPGIAGTLCIILDEDRSCPLTDDEELQQSIVAAGTSQISGAGDRYHTEDSRARMGVGLSSSFNEDFALYLLPVTINFNETWRTGLVVPWITVNEGEEGVGHILWKLGFFHAGRTAGFSASLGAFLPTGAAEVTPPKEYPDPYVDSALRLSFGRTTRLFIAVSATMRLADSTGLDRGDSGSLFFGWDTQLEGSLNYYTGVFCASTGEDRLDGYAMGNGIGLADFNAGLILPFIDLRLGITAPFYTESTVVGAGDRRTSIDMGFRFEI